MPLVLEKIYKGFCHIWAWQLCWSCDLDFHNIFVPKDPGCCMVNLLTIGPAVPISFKIVYGRRMDDVGKRSCPGAFGSGELKIKRAKFENLRKEGNHSCTRHVVLT